MVNRNSSLIKIIFACMFILILILVTLLLNNHNDESGDVEVIFLNLDNADAFIIKHDDYVAMIDTGEDKDLDIIKEKLEELKIDTINRLILTHPDKDHIGNAEYVITNYKVENIIQNNFDKNSSIQKSLNKQIRNLGITTNVITKNYNFYESGISFHLYGTNGDYDSNNSSIVILLKYGENRIFFGADIERDRIKEFLKYNLPVCQIVKLPHHGKYDDESISLLNKISPSIIISTGEVSENIVSNYKAAYYNTFDSEIIVDMSPNSYRIRSGGS